MINLYFGNPCDDWATETIIEIAIEEKISLDQAKLKLLKRLIEAISQRTEAQSYLDGIFGEFFGRVVYAPRMTAIPCEETKGAPLSIQMSSSYVIHRLTGDFWAIKSEGIEFFGKEIQSRFGIEYLGYRWTGSMKWLNLKQSELEILCT
jgi:hypothetical protein